MYKYNNNIHLAVKDISRCLKNIQDGGFSSIYDEIHLKKIQEMHNSYGINFTCFLENSVEDFTINDLDEKYCNELAENSTWLHFAWQDSTHASSKSGMEYNNYLFVKDFVCNNIKNTSWRNYILLNKSSYSEEFFNNYSESTFYVADIQEGLFPSNILNSIKLSGVIKIENNVYRDFDLHISVSSEKESLQNLINHCSERLNITQGKQQLQLLISLEALILKNELLCEIVDAIPTLHKNLTINTALYFDNDLYYTACNSNCLFKYDIHKKQVTCLAKLPCKTNYVMKYLRIEKYDDYLWFIPWAEDEFIIYNLKTKLIEVLSIPYKRKEKLYRIKYSNVIRDHNKLWLIPGDTMMIVCINMEDRSFEGYEVFPPDLHVEEGGQWNFQSMLKIENKIYIIGNKIKNNYIFDVTEKKLYPWEIGINGKYGVAIDNETIAFAPSHREEPLIIYHLRDKTKECIELSKDIFIDEKYFSFWNPIKDNDEILIIPQEAKTIVNYNIKTKRISYVIDYKNINDDNRFSGYNCIQVGEEKWITSYYGSDIVILDANNRYKDIYKMYCKLNEHTIETYSNSLRENSKCSLVDYIEMINFDIGVFKEKAKD